MNFLLIGGAGFLGLNIANSLIDNGHIVHLVDRHFQYSQQHLTLPNVAGKHEINSSDIYEILNRIDSLKIECVVNLASGLLPSSSYEAFSSEFATTILPGFKLLGELADRQVKYVYFSSGGTVYGSTEKHAASENDPTLPINQYGYSKIIFEQYVKFMSRSRGLKYLIVRPSNPYGPFQNPQKRQGLIAVAVDKILQKQQIEIWGDGSAIRDYIWVKDMANALTTLIEKNYWNEIFNIGTGNGYSVNDILNTIEDVTGIRANVIYKEARTLDVNRIVLDIRKLKSTIDFNPISLQDGIEKYLRGTSIVDL